MKANLGILPPLPGKFRKKAQRKLAYAQRARQSMLQSLRELDDVPINEVLKQETMEQHVQL